MEYENTELEATEVDVTTPSSCTSSTSTPKASTRKFRSRRRSKANFMGSDTPIVLLTLSQTMLLSTLQLVLLNHLYWRLFLTKRWHRFLLQLRRNRLVMMTNVLVTVSWTWIFFLVSSFLYPVQNAKIHLQSDFNRKKKALLLSYSLIVKAATGLLLRNVNKAVALTWTAGCITQCDVLGRDIMEWQDFCISWTTIIEKSLKTLFYVL